VNTREVNSARLAKALAGCPNLDRPSKARDNLWTVLWSTICTRHSVSVAPFGSTSAVTVTDEHASAELIAAVEWLGGNEATARSLSPSVLLAKLRSVGTQGDHGSARAARADELHGLTGVSPGDALRWVELDDGWCER